MVDEFTQKPDAIRRLGEDIFVYHKAKRLRTDEFEVVYVNEAFDKELVNELAIVLVDDACPIDVESITVYVDRQKDKTDISLSGNQGSGRAVYYGKKYNILGVGKTSLCTSTESKHSTGKMELVGSLRRVIVSCWINYFSERAGYHPVVLALKESKGFKWAQNPIPLAVLVRADEGYLDRPSHIEYLPTISINFEKILVEYAKMDAEFFAYRYMLGAWSNGNYSLDGRIIDLETISFTKYRGPYKTAGSKHIENFFGYEGKGFVLILKQLAEVKGVETNNIESRFFEERKKWLMRCFLTLQGAGENGIKFCEERYYSELESLTHSFEMLSKKIGPRRVNMNLYVGVSDEDDPSLLDMSQLFRNLAKLIALPDREGVAYDLLVRNVALDNLLPGLVYEPALTKDGQINTGEVFIKDEVVITYEQKKSFLKSVEVFIRDLFKLVDQLNNGGYLPVVDEWSKRLMTINQDLPTFNELNQKLFFLSEEYRLRRLKAFDLWSEVEKLCRLPWYNQDNY
ncbi:MAG: hypothetical protein HY226_03575 [Candidatus Vogelbacteria bacterium]|nr:hypothetical protein [Candidatus Vogelbacteria bacterium]